MKRRGFKETMELLINNSYYGATTPTPINLQKQHTLDKSNNLDKPNK